MNSLITVFKKKKIKLILSFLTNYPTFSLELKNNNLIWQNSSKKAKTIKIKYFIIFICLLNFFLKKKKTQMSKIQISFVLLKLRKKLITTLRAPFRNKLAKKHFSIQFWKLICVIELYNETEQKKLNNTNYLPLIEILKLNLQKFESNLCSYHKIQFVVTPKFYLNNFQY